ncbi:Tim44-like domain-containing protein [Ramlibacter tataouinensis]|uniref:Tim44 domain-containing protein n=1 Tax=Ramlibacter tataouinensis TaxID=94132 RepID=UPI0022F3EA4A|nr:Tim44-like domain-containing protein [Ramlibacter tataouinensis]WBY02701.1 Tim44-like domain-containing protein [Ramlibacter tataouinensis]
MKKSLAAAAIVLTLGLTAGLDAEARRLGGGKSAGMQRQNTTAPANNTPAQPAANPGAASPAPAAAAAPTAAAAAPKRNWMGPVAGLAAGLGLAALASHLGFGEALANMMMIGLLVMAVLVVVGLVLRKRAASQGPALAGAAGPGLARDGMARQAASSAEFRSVHGETPAPRGSLIGSRLGGFAPTAAQPAGLPADFDAAAFARNAKDQFMALQAANDAGDLDRLRDYLTPEMFEVVRIDLAERGAAPQATQVFGLEAQVLSVEQEPDRYIVSVRFTGSVRDQHGAVPESLDEVWHLAKPVTGMGGWVVAGIQQLAQA